MLVGELKVGVLELHAGRHLLVLVVLLLEVLVDVLFHLLLYSTVPLSLLVLLLLVLVFFILVVALLAHAPRPALLPARKADAVLLQAVRLLAGTRHSRILGHLPLLHPLLFDLFAGLGIAAAVTFAQQWVAGAAGLKAFALRLGALGLLAVAAGLGEAEHVLVFHADAVETAAAEETHFVGFAVARAMIFETVTIAFAIVVGSTVVA